jgi:hypothetical protein
LLNLGNGGRYPNSVLAVVESVGLSSMYRRSYDRVRANPYRASCERIVPKTDSATRMPSFRLVNLLLPPTQRQIMKSIRITFTLLVIALVGNTTTRAQDTLPSWNDGPAKQAIVDFVRTTTETGGAKFVPPEERVATFDQNGTLSTPGSRKFSNLCAPNIAKVGERNVAMPLIIGLPGLCPPRRVQR